MPSNLSNAPARERLVTLQSVAKAAGVSAMTVSNVVNGRFDMMSAATRANIESLIERLGYRQDSSARGLRLAQRFSVGMIVVDPLPSFLADPFITQVVAGLSNVLGARGFGLTLAGAPNERISETVVLRSNSTDALCVMLSGPRAQRQRCLRRIGKLGQPIVLIQEQWHGTEPNICSVRQDDDNGAETLARRVFERGARDVIFLVPSLAWPAVEARERGIRKAARRVRGAPITLVACGDEHFVTTQRALDNHVQTHGLPNAIMAANDQMGIAALKWMRMRELEAPRDVLLTGFNAFDFWQYSEPLLTTMRSPAYELGECSGREVLHYLDQGEFSAQEVVLPVVLISGETT